MYFQTAKKKKKRLEDIFSDGKIITILLYVDKVTLLVLKAGNQIYIVMVNHVQRRRV